MYSPWALLAVGLHEFNGLPSVVGIQTYMWYVGPNFNVLLTLDRATNAAHGFWAEATRNSFRRTTTNKAILGLRSRAGLESSRPLGRLATELFGGILEEDPLIRKAVQNNSLEN